MAISEVTVIAIAGADASSGSLALTSTDTTGGSAALLVISHEGAPTTYTWSDNKSTAGGNFIALGTVNGSIGGGAGDISLNAVYVHGFTGAAGHVFTCTLGASRPYRYGGGVILGGTFGATHLAATTQTAEGTDGTVSSQVDAGSLVTDAPAYLIQFANNYTGQTMTNGSGWTTKSNATGGRHFQARNEGSSGTFDPVLTLSGVGNPYLTIAAAIKETAGGGGTYNAVPTIYGYNRARKLLN